MDNNNVTPLKPKKYADSNLPDWMGDLVKGGAYALILIVLVVVIALAVGVAIRAWEWAV